MNASLRKSLLTVALSLTMIGCMERAATREHWSAGAADTTRRPSPDDRAEETDQVALDAAMRTKDASAARESLDARAHAVASDAGQTQARDAGESADGGMSDAGASNDEPIEDDEHEEHERFDD